MTRIRLAGVLTLAMVFASCGTGAPAEPETVKVAFIVDLSGPGALEHVLPARQGAELALRIAEITNPSAKVAELVELDIDADPEVVEAVEADQAFVAVIVAPGVHDDLSIGGSGLPTVSLSDLGATPPESAAWLRFVAPVDVLAESLTDHVPSSATCILSDEPVSDEPASDGLGELLAEHLGSVLSRIEPSSAGRVVERSGCTTVAWVGSPDGGAEAARALEDSRIAFTGGDGLLGPDFLDLAGPAAEGALSTCSCADVSTSLDLDVQRFIQDYQAEFGSAPGAYAVEGWDAANLLMQALRAGEPTRDSARRFLGSVMDANGLGRTYRFGSDGELVDPRNFVVTYLALGGRWTAAVADQAPG